MLRALEAIAAAAAMAGAAGSYNRGFVAFHRVCCHTSKVTEKPTSCGSGSKISEAQREVAVPLSMKEGLHPLVALSVIFDQMQSDLCIHSYGAGLRTDKPDPYPPTVPYGEYFAEGFVEAENYRIHVVCVTIELTLMTIIPGPQFRASPSIFRANFMRYFTKEKPSVHIILGRGEIDGMLTVYRYEETMRRVYKYADIYGGKGKFLRPDHPLRKALLVRESDFAGYSQEIPKFIEKVTGTRLPSPENLRMPLIFEDQITSHPTRHSIRAALLKVDGKVKRKFGSPKPLESEPPQSPKPPQRYTTEDATRLAALKVEENLKRDLSPKASHLLDSPEFAKFMRALEDAAKKSPNGREEHEKRSRVLEILFSNQVPDTGGYEEEWVLTSERITQFLLVNGPLAVSSTTYAQVSRNDWFETVESPFFAVCFPKLRNDESKFRDRRRVDAPLVPNWWDGDTVPDLLSQSSKIQVLEGEHLEAFISFGTLSEFYVGSHRLETDCAAIAFNATDFKGFSDFQRRDQSTFDVNSVFIKYQGNSVAAWVRETQSLDLWDHFGAEVKGLKLGNLLEKLKWDVMEYQMWPPFVKKWEKKRKKRTRSGSSYASRSSTQSEWTYASRSSRRGGSYSSQGSGSRTSEKSFASRESAKSWGSWDSGKQTEQWDEWD